MLRTEERGRGAFTLIELMVVVAIIGVLAAVAIPTLIRYIRKAKSAEATANVRKIADGARSYFMEDSERRQLMLARFPADAPLTPPQQCCPGKCAPDPALWETPAWIDLKFQMADAHYYQYEFVSAGTGTSAAFTARAHGNLDCDSLISTFEIAGWYHGADVFTSGGLYAKHQDE